MKDSKMILNILHMNVMEGRLLHPPLLRLTLLLLTISLVGCATPVIKSKYSVKAPYREPSALKRGEIMHVETGRTLSKEELFDYISSFRVVYVGETHDSVEDHQVQLEIIKGLYRRFPRKIALGFEMLKRPSQADADAFISGKLSQKEFLKVWSRNWHGMYDYYIDIIKFARKNNIKMLALNTEDELRKTFRDTEIEKLDEETKNKLPEMRFDDPHYNAFIEAIFAGHGQKGGSTKHVEMFKRMQTLWDETMADTASNYLKSPEGRKKILIVIAGGGHIQYGYGIPRRLFRRSPLPYVTIEPYPVEVAKAKANNTIQVKPVEIPLKPFDFYWAVKYEGLEDKQVMLGISMEKNEEGDIRVAAVVPGSAAEKAGIIAGDVIVSMDGTKVKEYFDITYNVRKRKPNDTGNVEISRDGNLITFNVTYDIIKPHNNPGKPTGE